MNLTVYIDAACGKDLAKYSKLEKKSRNAIVREAIHDWLKRRESASQWPETVTAFQGVPDMEPFEKHRKALLPPKLNRFA